MSDERISDSLGCLVILAILLGLPFLAWKGCQEELADQDAQRWLIIDSNGFRYEDVRYPVMQNCRNDEVTFEWQGRHIDTYAPRLVERVDKHR